MEGFDLADFSGQPERLGRDQAKGKLSIGT
jgi:hypothetical protein